MGSYYTSCEHCGEELAARWDWDEDSEDQIEPKEVGRRRQEHLSETRGPCATIRKLKARVTELEAEVSNLEALVESQALQIEDAHEAALEARADASRCGE